MSAIVEQKEIITDDWRGLWVELYCDSCGGPFRRLKSLAFRVGRNTQKHFCSIECRNKGAKGYKHSTESKARMSEGQLRTARRMQSSPYWKGGRYTDKNGYVRLHAPSHPHATTNGWALEHIVVACGLLGRPLMKGEEVHHQDHNRSNNSIFNLEVLSKAEHSKRHHNNPNNRALGEPNILIACACDCGNQVLKYDSRGRKRKYIHGHNQRSH